MADRQSIGRALQGFGAGVRGRGAEFIQGIETQRKELSAERRNAALLDNRVLGDHLRNGRLPQARQLLLNRIQALQQLDPNADPSDSLEQLNNIDTGNIDLAISEAEVVDREAVIRGELPAAARPEAFTLSPGQARFEGGRQVASLPAGGQNQQKQINTLRNDITKVSKDFRAIENAKKRIDALAKRDTAASDIGLIFNIMKMFDPGSTVREGEFATAQNAAGVPDRIRNTFNRLKEGTRLSDNQRKDFIATAKNAFAGQRSATDNQIESILQQADEDKIGRQRVFGKQRLSAFNARRNRATFESTTLGRKVSQLELEETAQAEGVTLDEVRKRLGIN